MIVRAFQHGTMTKHFEQYGDTRNIQRKLSDEHNGHTGDSFPFREKKQTKKLDHCS